MSTAEAAARAGVDRTTILRVKEVATQGALDALAASRPGGRHDGPDPELVAAKAEIARLSEALKETAVKLTLAEAKNAGTEGPGPLPGGGRSAAAATHDDDQILTGGRVRDRGDLAAVDAVLVLVQAGAGYRVGAVDPATQQTPGAWPNSYFVPISCRAFSPVLAGDRGAIG